MRDLRTCKGIDGIEYGVNLRTQEHQLWAAVLEKAISDACAQRTAKLNGDKLANETIRIDAVRWFECEEFEVGSFSWICEVLDLDPNPLRRQILSLAATPTHRRVLPLHRMREGRPTRPYLRRIPGLGMLLVASELAA